MGAKVGGIILLVIALGVGLYFVNSGGFSKFGAVFTPPGGGTTSTTGAASSTAIAPVTTTSTSTAPTSAGSFGALLTFFSNIFHPQSVSGPSVGGGMGVGGSATGGQGSGGYYSGGSSATPSTSSIPANQIPAGLTLAQLSPYFHWVRFNGLSSYNIGLAAPGNPFVYGQAPSTAIDVTGWEIKTNHGGEYIPQAINIYNPSGAPILNDIVLTTNKNDVVYFYSNSSPANLRMNECMGYLSAANNQFNPPLPYSCPVVNQAAISQFSGQCQNYIDSLGCNPVNMSDTRIPRTDYACQQYLQDNFTYNSCISNHALDSNFLSNEWHVWMGSSPIDSYHDNVQLLDKNGLVVDSYSY